MDILTDIYSIASLEGSGGNMGDWRQPVGPLAPRGSQVCWRIWGLGRIWNCGRWGEDGVSWEAVRYTGTNEKDNLSVCFFRSTDSYVLLKVVTTNPNESTHLNRIQTNAIPPSLDSNPRETTFKHSQACPMLSHKLPTLYIQPQIW